MNKAKLIDRLELTRQKFKGKGLSTYIPQAEGDLYCDSPEVDEARFEQEQLDDGLKECPNCGAKSLRLDGGCMSCLSCGWSACG